MCIYWYIIDVYSASNVHSFGKGIILDTTIIWLTKFDLLYRQIIPACTRIVCILMMTKYWSNILRSMIFSGYQSKSFPNFRIVYWIPNILSYSKWKLTGLKLTKCVKDSTWPSFLCTNFTLFLKDCFWLLWTWRLILLLNVWRWGFYYCSLFTGSDQEKILSSWWL